MDKQGQGTEYAIVLGAPRSGTTFLMSFLDAMPATEAVTGNLIPTVIPHVDESRALAGRARGVDVSV